MIEQQTIEYKANWRDDYMKWICGFANASGGKLFIGIDDDISIPDLLEKLRLLENGHLKRAAIVLFGKDPGRFYSNMTVKIGKFGNTDADLKFHEVIEGNLIQLKDGIGEMLNAKFFIHPIDFMGMQRVELDEYPVAAVREMILNSLVHRKYMGAPTQIRLYDDNFSVWNDGELPEGITEEDLKKVHRSKPRNPLIADTCFKAGYIDSWGRGTIKIIEACKKAGLPEPVLKDEQGGFLSMIFKGSEKVRRKYGENTENKQESLTALREKYGENAEKVRRKC